MAEERKGFLREAVELFGFRIGRPEKEEPLPSFVPQNIEDGAVAISEGGAFGTIEKWLCNQKQKKPLMTYVMKL